MVLFQVPWTRPRAPFTLAFRCVLYDSRVFCYPLPQFAGVNSVDVSTSHRLLVTESAEFPSDGPSGSEREVGFLQVR